MAFLIGFDGINNVYETIIFYVHEHSYAYPAINWVNRASTRNVQYFYSKNTEKWGMYSENGLNTPNLTIEKERRVFIASIKVFWQTESLYLSRLLNPISGNYQTISSIPKSFHL